MADPHTLEGIVEAGRGLGVPRMSQGDSLVRLRELLGLPVIPGTLNVRLDEPMDRSLLTHYLPASQLSSDWESETDQGGYFWATVLIEGTYHGVIIQADEPEYPLDLVEVLSDTHLRQALDLSAEDSIRFSIVAP